MMLKFKSFDSSGSRNMTNNGMNQHYFYNCPRKYCNKETGCQLKYLFEKIGKFTLKGGLDKKIFFFLSLLSFQSYCIFNKILLEATELIFKKIWQCRDCAMHLSSYNASSTNMSPRDIDI